VITVVTWLYSCPRELLTPQGNKERRVYTPAHVNNVLKMLDRWMDWQFEMVCVTDDPEGLDPRIKPFPMPSVDFNNKDLDPRYPACHRILWMFSKEAAVLGDRLFKVDLDDVITGPLSPLVGRQEPLVVARKGKQILGCTYLITPGAYAHVWEEFEQQKGKLPASDQEWMNHMLSPNTPSFGPEHYLVPIPGTQQLPSGTSIAAFGTYYKPWHKEAQARNPWIKDFYPL